MSQPVGGRGPERSRLPNWLPTEGLIPRSRSLDSGDSVGEVCTAGSYLCAWLGLDLGLHYPFWHSVGQGRRVWGRVLHGRWGKLGLCPGTAAGAMTLMVV